jgi:hypothetical protein
MQIESFFNERRDNGETKFDTIVRWFCIIAVPLLIIAIILAKVLR